MTLSYDWLHNYLPEKIAPQKLSKILTAIGLEVESQETYSNIKGGLQGLVAGKVLTCEQHPDADKLKLTTVDIGTEEKLQIVCGAVNVAAGQKVVVATIGTTIFPLEGEPFSIKKAKIRGVQSEGMLCAEDEIGVGGSHDGIMILDEATEPGKPLAEILEVYEDIIFEIGLTPNRMDAMSHRGVARDVIAYINHHEKQQWHLPEIKKDEKAAKKFPKEYSIEIKNEEDCRRYCGVAIDNIAVGESPLWLRNALLSIGVKPINNIVDITNYILHDTGQPLHAFDAAKLAGNTILVRNAEKGEKFITLDAKEKTLRENDLLICDEKGDGKCLAGVYGGQNSGVTNDTTSIFLESAWFAPATIRKTSVELQLRTEAAARFEKGVDISQCLQVLKEASKLIVDNAGGTIASPYVDAYPAPVEPSQIALQYHYLKKLSGKNYHSDSIKNILTALGFKIEKDDIDALTVLVPLHKPDITLPADLVEEIMRIDGLDNIEIPKTISIAPATDPHQQLQAAREKVSNYLVGLGFNEIFTNSISNGKYYEGQAGVVKMINNLSADLDVMRPAMLPSGLEVIAYNLNRKNNNLRFFEFGKTYHEEVLGIYKEVQHLALYATGSTVEANWQSKEKEADLFYVKEACFNILRSVGILQPAIEQTEDGEIHISVAKKVVGNIQVVSTGTLQNFGIKQTVCFADLNWDAVLEALPTVDKKYKEISKFPAVQRDLALVVDKQVTYASLEKAAKSTQINQLRSVSLFDVFEDKKLGEDKKSMALSFTFLDEYKTLTEAEIEAMVAKLITVFEKEVQAQVRGN